MATLGEIAEVNGANRADTDDRRKREREHSRLKKARQRARKAEHAERAAEVEAKRIEDEAKRRELLDEELAPGVLRAPILAAAIKATSWHPGRPEMMLVGPRVRIVDGRPVRALADQIADDPLAPHGASTIPLTDRQRRAVRTLRLDWADVGQGTNSGAVDYLRAGGGGGDGLGGHVAMLEQIAVRARFEGAMTYVGAFAPGIARVVLDCIPISVWRAEVEMPREKAIAWLRAGLSRLADFYWPPKEMAENGLKPLMFGPSRASYDIDTPDMERTKIVSGPAGGC